LRASVEKQVAGAMCDRLLGLVGAIGRVTLHGAESGICVLRIKTYGHCGLIAMMGHAAIGSAGVWVTINGR